MMILVSEIGYDPKYYPRVNGDGDWLTVHRYRDALSSDERKQFPPVVLVKNPNGPYRYLLLDGRHRTKAYHAAEREKIPAVVEHLPESKWFARSVELNATHGRALDTGDKAWIAKRLEQDGYTEEDVAKLLHMRVESLQKIKVEHVVKLKATAAKNIPQGRSHRQIEDQHFGFLKTPFKEFANSNEASDALSVQGPVASMNVINILDSAIAVLRMGVDLSDEEIAGRVERLRELLRSA